MAEQAELRRPQRYLVGPGRDEEGAGGASPAERAGTRANSCTHMHAHSTHPRSARLGSARHAAGRGWMESLIQAGLQLAARRRYAPLRDFCQRRVSVISSQSRDFFFCVCLGLFSFYLFRRARMPWRLMAALQPPAAPPGHRSASMAVNGPMRRDSATARQRSATQ